jgi:hypothetical protein
VTEIPGRAEPDGQGCFVENQGAPQRRRRPVAGSSLPVMDLEDAAGHYLLRVFII